MHLWIVEANGAGSRRNIWQPVLGFPGVSGVHFNREGARKAAKEMQVKNTYNHLGSGVLVRYRAVKYVRYQDIW